MMKKAEGNILVLHLEKILLAVGVLVLGAVVFLFVIGSPYEASVKPGRGAAKKVGPRSVEQLVEDAAKRLDNKLKNTSPGFDQPAIPDYTEELAAAYETPLLASSGFTPMTGHPLSIDDEVLEVEFILPPPPMPATVIARADYALMQFDQVFDPRALAGLQQLVGNQTPADFRYVSATAIFDMNKWQERVQQIPVDQRVPDLIFRNNLYITGVFLVRQEFDPQNNTWGETVTLKPMPGQVHFLPDDSMTFDRESGKNAVQLIKTNSDDFAKVEFPPVSEIRPWAPPHVTGKRLDREQREQINEINREIARKERQIAAQRRALGIQGNNTSSTGRTGGSTGRQASSAGSGNDSQNPRRERLAKLETEVIMLERRRDLIRQGLDPDEVSEENLTESNRNPDLRNFSEFSGQDSSRVNRGAQPGSGDFTSPRDARFSNPQEDRQSFGERLPRGQFRVWAHDLTVQPEKTYRYKVVVSVLNPLFQNRQLPAKQRVANEHRISLLPSEDDIAAAPWSEKVVIPPESYFFVVDGSVNNHNAQVEVYRVFQGAMQVKTFTTQPGDLIGGPVKVSLENGREGEIDMSVGFYMIDIVSSTTTNLGAQSSRMLYLDPQTNQIANRDIAQDKESPLRRDLEFQVNEAREAREEIETQALRGENW